jgi:hypothetical protein
VTVALTIQKEAMVVVEWRRGKRGDSNADSEIQNHGAVFTVHRHRMQYWVQPEII